VIDDSTQGVLQGGFRDRTSKRNSKDNGEKKQPETFVYEEITPRLPVRMISERVCLCQTEE